MKKLHLVLIAIIALGIVMRFYALDKAFINGDEEFYIIAAEKFHVGSDYDVRIWNYHAPPVAKYIMGLSLAGTRVDYSIPYAIPPNLWVWNYVAFESIGQVYSIIRTVSAIFGVIFVIFIFLSGKELFGRTAGLWVAASAAVAIDYIVLSRVVLIDIYLYAFMAGAVFFYIKYRKALEKAVETEAKTKGTFRHPAVWLIGFFVFFLLTIGTKNAQWLVLLPGLFYTEIIGNKKKVLRTVNFLIVIGIAWFIHSSFIYPEEFSKPAYEFFTQGANKNLIEPHLDTFFTSLGVINSPFFLAAFIATIAFYLWAISRKKWAGIRKHLTNPDGYTFVLILTIASLAAFSLTSLSQNVKSVGQISIPFFILGGLAVAKITGSNGTEPRKTKEKAALGVFLGLLAIGAFSAVWFAPDYEKYPGQQILGISTPGELVNPLLDFLKEKGNPPVVTNEMNLLIFYKNYGGQAVPIPVKDSPACSQELIDQIKAANAVVIFKNVGEVEKGFLCDRLFNYTEELEIPGKRGNVRAVIF